MFSRIDYIRVGHGSRRDIGRSGDWGFSSLSGNYTEFGRDGHPAGPAREITIRARKKVCHGCPVDKLYFSPR